MKTKFTTLLALIKREKNAVIIFCVSFILFLIPQLIWKNYGYFVGGDDTLLHYMYPNQMIEKYANNIAINNSLSGPHQYIERLHLLPLLHLISIVNFLTGVSNSLYIFLGIILSASFLSFFFLMEEIEPKFKGKLFIEKLSVSFLYTFSVHHYLSVLNYKLLVMYIVFLVPLTLLIFTKAVFNNKQILLIPAALISTLFSVVLVGVPWLFGYLISASSLLLYIFIKYPKRFLNFSTKFLLLLFIYNIFWISHFTYAVVSNSPETNLYRGILTAEFRQRNIDAILTVTNQNNLYDSLLGFFHPVFQKSFNWPTYNIFENWSSQFILLNVIILLSICLSALFYKRKRYSDFYPFAILGWLVTVYFFTVNMMGRYGTRLFLFLNENIPGFSMFRNNYDKFASGMAFSIALLLFSLTLVINQSSNSPRLRNIWLIIIVVFVSISTLPVVRGDYERDILITTTNTRSSIEEFDGRFLKLTTQLGQIQNKSVIWLPLSRASYITIQDKRNSNHVYSGLSPLLFLSGVHDYAGILSFRPNESDIFSKAIETQNPVTFGNALKKLGITHVIVNNTITEDMKNSYLYGSDFVKKQSKEFIYEIVGEKIISIDDAFILYKVRDEYYQEIFYFNQGCKVTEFKLISREKYLIKYDKLDTELEADCQLVFKQPFHKSWLLLSQGSEQMSTITDEFQNSWLIKPESGELTVYFKPRKYVLVFKVISLIAIVVSLIIFVKNTIKK